jgi:multidrug transporter EmrE-like cation transporter
MIDKLLPVAITLAFSAVGVLCSVSTMLLLALVGVVSFKETLNAAELAGLAMAIGSVFLLVRFG